MTFRDFCTGFRDYWPNFVAKHWNFSQCRNGYSAGYTPKYPEKTAADFDVYPALYPFLRPDYKKV